jgi:GntR family transcriptional regulator
VSERPKYQAIADDLRAAILSGDLRDGDQLPGENALMERYGVARMTARQALAAIQAEGLSTTRRGAGVFVRSFAPIRRHGSQRLSARQWGSGRSVWDVDTAERPVAVDQLKVFEDRASERVARLLAVEPGEAIWVRRRRYSVDRQPVMLAVSSLPAALVTGTAITRADTGPGGIYARLSELGRPPVRFVEELRARMPMASEVDALALPPATPVIQVVRTALDAEGRPVEVNEMVLDASAYVLDYEFGA